MGLASVFSTEPKDRTIEIDVTGMTCEKCVKHVVEALEHVEGVKNISVLLNSGKTSRVTILTDIEQDNDHLKELVEKAGYQVTDIRRDD